LVIIESKDDLKLFETENEKQDSFVIPILSDTKKHPLDNELCLIYIQMMDGQEFMASYNHSESLNNHKVNLVSKTTKYTYDKKLLNHVCSVGKVIDVNLLHYMRTNNPLDIERIDTNAHNFLNMRYYKKNNINTIIPMLKHLEYCRELCKLLRFELETGGDSDDKMTYNNEVLDNLSYIESTGLQTTEDMVYSEYNLYTSTGRPSNRFGGLNFAALNKKDGSREKFISRYKNGVLVEMDYDGYHLRLIADRIGYEFPKGSVHEHMAKLYGTDYSEAKSLSFQYLYGYIPKEIQENNEYFSRVHEYIQKLWIEYKSKDFIVSDIYNKRIYKKNLTDMNANKLFNYTIQLMETENNMRVLSELIPKIDKDDYKSKLILYNYDAFLFDFNMEDGLDYLKKVKGILEQAGRFPVKVGWGLNYHDMKDITEKFV